MKRSFGVIIILIVLIFTAYTFDVKKDKFSNSTNTYSNLSSIQKTSTSGQAEYNNLLINKLNSPSYVSHRGLVSNKPENSMPAFRSSKDIGFKIVETDLHLTKDGQWILMHDNTLDRTTNGKGEVRNYNLGQIRKYRLRSNDPNIEDKDLIIPTLDEFLKLCSEQDLWPILDIKPNERRISSKAYNSLLSSLRKYNLVDKSIICSYSKGVLTEVRKLEKNITIAVMMDVTEDTLQFAKDLGNAFIYYNYKTMSEDKLKQIEKSKLKYGVWTIDGKEDAEYFKSKGSIMIVTDRLLPEEYQNINIAKVEP